MERAEGWGGLWEKEEEGRPRQDDEVRRKVFERRSWLEKQRTCVVWWRWRVEANREGRREGGGREVRGGRSYLQRGSQRGRRVD